MPAIQGLNLLAQEDFSGGAYRSIARHLIPAQGTYDVENGLHDEDGSIYRRGGSKYLTTAGPLGIRWVADAVFPAGQRTIFGTSSQFGVVAADDLTPINAGSTAFLEPAPSAMLGGVLYIAVGSGLLYGGSRKAAYSIGTVTATLGSKIVTGSGTSWLANVDAGILLRVGSDLRQYRVASVDSNTQLTLAENYESGTVAGASYLLAPTALASNSGIAAGLYAVCADKLVSAVGNRVVVSKGIDPGPTSPGGVQLGNFRAHQRDPNDFHDLPDGADVVALATIRDRVFAFTTAGLYMISGIAYPIVDEFGNPQRRVELVSSDLIAWTKNGIATWHNSLVVACTDGVYLVDGVSAPRPVSRSISLAYQAYVRSGYRAGQPAVYKGHLFLPIYDLTNTVVDHLVCRLDRPVTSPVGEVFPWSRLSGHASNAMALAVRGTSTPELIAGGRTDGRILKMGQVFEPSSTTKNDADGTTFKFQIDTRDYRTGAGNRNLVRRVQLRYELIDAAADEPNIAMFYSTGGQRTGASLWDQVNWDAFNWATADEVDFSQAETGAPPDDGRTPWDWEVNAHTEFVRYRLTCVRPCARLVIRGLGSWIRPSGKVF